MPPTGVDVATPAGLAKMVAIGAAECLKGARDLDAGFPDLTGEYILIFHSIELGLKAYLINNGLSEQKLSKKPYGHDLIALYEKAKCLGLKLTFPNADEMISWINEWHCGGVKIRYRFNTDRLSHPLIFTPPQTSD